MFNVRGNLSPLLRLYHYFGLSPRNTVPCQATVILVESSHESRCIHVDDLLGLHEVVIKSLGDRFKSNRMPSGYAILGDGRSISFWTLGHLSKSTRICDSLSSPLEHRKPALNWNVFLSGCLGSNVLFRLTCPMASRT